MAYFPMFVELDGKECLIIGGGKVALRKAVALLDFKASLTIVASSMIPEFIELEAKHKPYIKLIERDYKEEDLQEAFLVIAATDDKELNRRISLACKTKGIPVNVVDVKEECSFIFPAYVRKQSITVGITSSGNSPVLTQQIKKTVEKNLPDYMGLLADKMGDARKLVKSEFHTERERKQVYIRMAEVGEKKKGNLTEEDICVIMKEMKKELHQDCSDIK
ncbi:bifunctional precorrin-2 dehydrogenase/sirohydrochlorin ferrochelatase [Anaerocolumna sp. AGMB13020]|uniref:precorrin-2 dehydrogenase/sirohydrochlorin ferrochelatase family protein n=1 Tax=Anaerocolumna sp. AGMB13020 TaxID=3081750 RepID=UPI0029549348|nr:bifunctional precorrin-2 dehydrogenase/sirohydrochlorin ferrochelatase [Anaerocolumna sp. AGMB13020]WOO36448.1 bifunctional precorrin-2 dehydrogenase/sirohydrochlorin ferrochelatase [Anaerocolumna sp. AGMB13020]